MGEFDAALFQPYVDILLDRGVIAGVIGPREADRIWDRHILNSLALADLIPIGASVVDVGSGAGLPGIPLAIARPDLSVTLLEPLLRRTTFLEPVVRELGLGARVRVVRARAEDHHQQYDVVTARALAPLDRLIRWCRPLLKDGGTLLALKGRSAEDEIQAARDILATEHLSARVLEVRAAPDAEPTRVVRVT
ncbi:MAG TPA: 16S rRNA (guanine(527)-N(7))-methyltransferase RsmG [Microlunatus sp.]